VIFPRGTECRLRLPAYILCSLDAQLCKLAFFFFWKPLHQPERMRCRLCSILQIVYSHDSPTTVAPEYLLHLYTLLPASTRRARKFAMYCEARLGTTKPNRINACGIREISSLEARNNEGKGHGTPNDCMLFLRCSIDVIMVGRSRDFRSGSWEKAPSLAVVVPSFLEFSPLRISSFETHCFTYRAKLSSLAICYHFYWYVAICSGSDVVGSLMSILLPTSSLYHFHSLDQ
jgi:hypothetical protein